MKNASARVSTALVLAAVAALAAAAAPSALTPAERAFLAKPTPLLNWWDIGKYEEARAKKPPVPHDDRPVYVRATVTDGNPWNGILALSDAAIGRRFFKGRAWLIGSNGALRLDDAKARPKWLRPLSAGEPTPWIDVTDSFVIDRVQVVDLVAFRDVAMVLRPDDAPKWLQAASYRVEFSRTPGEDGVFGVFERSGPGIQMCGLVSRRDGMAVPDDRGSLFDLERARAAAADLPCDEVRPRRFRIALSKTAGVRLDRCSPQSVENAAETFRLLGVNDLGGANPDLEARLDPKGEFVPELLGRDPGGSLNPARISRGCPCTVDCEMITNNLKKLAARWQAPLSAGRRLVVGIADEFGLGDGVMTNCASAVRSCRERFREYLAEKGVAPGELGCRNMDEVDFCLDHSNPYLFYWTMRYRTELIRRLFLEVSNAARAVAPGILVTANVGIELVFGGNIVKGGMDPFELMECGAVMQGLTEDWSNMQYTYQFCSYVCDVWRSASERCGRRFSILSVMKQDEFQTAAKAFSEVGHGAEGIEFFAWGPTWNGGGDCRNQCDGVYPGMRAFARATRAVEDLVVDGRVAKGDVALLLSVTGDYHELRAAEKRSWIEQNPYGKNRMSLSLLLDHCGVRSDIICEDDLPARLPGYKVLFVADRTLRRSAAEAICRWAEAGGVVVLAPGAMEADERQLPLPRPPAAQVRELGFSPWKEYIVASSDLGGWYSHREFPAELRARTKELCRELRVHPLVRSSHHLVETSVLESPRGRLVVVANWSGERRDVKIGLLGRLGARRARRASGEPCSWKRVGDALVVEMNVGSGDYLVLED